MTVPLYCLRRYVKGRSSVAGVRELQIRRSTSAGQAPRQDNSRLRHGQLKDDLSPRNPGWYALFGIECLSALKASPIPAPGTVLGLRDSVLEVFELLGSTDIRVAGTLASVTGSRADLGSQAASCPAPPRPLLHRPSRRCTRRCSCPAPRSPPAGLPRTAVGHSDRAAVQVRWCVVQPGGRSLERVLRPSLVCGGGGAAGRHEIVVPALAGITLSPGRHHIAFRFTRVGGYPELPALAAADLLAFAITARNRFLGWGSQ
jgi:hypothetical protein